MPKNDKNKRQDVNKIRRKQEDESLFSGRVSKLPDDVKKVSRETSVDVPRYRKSKAQVSVQREIRKGRKPAEEKEKKGKDRHTPRKSEIEKEYTKELQKLRNRLKYRENQGFFVQWETLPSRKLNPTMEDVEALKTYAVLLNEKNEIELKRMEYAKQAREASLNITKDKLAKEMFIKNQYDFSPPVDNVGEFDVVDMIDEHLWHAYYVVSHGSDEDPITSQSKLRQYDVDAYVELEMFKQEALHEAIVTFNSQVRAYPRNILINYYLQHEQQITNMINMIIQESKDRTLIAEVKQDLIRYLVVH